MQNSNRIKVVFKSETKKFKKPETFESLLSMTQKAYGASLPPTFKFFYSDSDGDIISISCQEDLEEAYESIPQLRLIIEESSEAARFNMDPDYSMRSSINVMGQNNFNSNRNASSFFFEEVRQNQQSVSKGVDA